MLNSLKTLRYDSDKELQLAGGADRNTLDRLSFEGPNPANTLQRAVMLFAPMSYLE